MSQITLTVNGAAQALELEPDMPLLYALRNHLNLNGANTAAVSVSAAPAR